jgi:nitrate/TMAO reductase-like tetraheme cytochrome c subunit
MVKVLAAVLVVGAFTGTALAFQSNLPKELTEETRACVACHQEQNPGLYQMWGASKHYGANVGCYECHRAEKGDKDILKDGIHDEFTIATIVSPADCARCHTKEVDEFTTSHHSKAGRIMGSLDNLLAEVIEGNNGLVTPMFPAGISAVAVNGCWQCHGGVVQILKDGTPDPATWPNTGMGRVNPDGSEGSCTACHQRHEFSAAQARHPDNCGKCHLGPDHPQKEIYEESKHGIAFFANEGKMNLSSSKWIVGEDYTTAPTCATCHMSATKNQKVSHNIGLRIKWNNRPPRSKLSHETDQTWKLASAAITADTRRTNMKDVCASCHQTTFVDGFFVQYEGLLELYDKKYAVPGLELYQLATAVLKTDTTYAEFSRPVDWTWFEIWHHEGRRARHGAAMQAPDYTHWHGTYEMAKHWMRDFVPELKEIMAEYKSSAPKEVEALEAGFDRVMNSDNWRWALNKEDPKVKAARQKRQEEFNARYK